MNSKNIEGYVEIINYLLTNISGKYTVEQIQEVLKETERIKNNYELKIFECHLDIPKEVYCKGNDI